MKQAMILAAGKGTRLQPVTQSIPKALVPIQQKPALAWLIQRMRHHLHVESILINTHYLSNQLKAFVEQYPEPEPKLTLSIEENLLDTGGGLWQTRDFWEDEPFLLHNVDVICSAPVDSAMASHQMHHPLATLFVKKRKTANQLLIDEIGIVCGIHRQLQDDYQLLRKPRGTVQEFGFCGIHLISPQIFEHITERGSFSIIDCYLRLIQEGFLIRAHDIGNAHWYDVGTPEKLATLESDWQQEDSLRQAYEMPVQGSFLEQLKTS